MKQFIYHSYIAILTIVLASLCLTSCMDEEDWKQTSATGREIQLIVSKPDDSPSSKAPNLTKEAFKNGDIIHISATFTPINQQPAIENQYACMKFNGTDWVAHEGTSLVWPWNAATGTFTAYYIPGTTSAMKEGSHFEMLSKLSANVIKNGEDPLKATYTNVPVGSAVHLQFNHLCTKLTFINLEKAISTNQELYIVGVTDSLVFTLAADKTLSSVFENKLNYVHNKVEGTTTGETNSKTLTFLLPEITADTKLKLVKKDFSPYHSFTVPQQLNVGKHYSIDITKLADNYIDDSIKEEDWTDTDGDIQLESDDINTYLQAIRDGVEYRKDNKQILIVYTDGDKQVVAQIRDVDFQNKVFTPVNISDNITFQGNNHVVKNIHITQTISDEATVTTPSPLDGDICGALFGRNKGIIKNLILENVTMDLSNNTPDLKYVGALVGKNIDGIIENIKVRFKGANNVIKATSTNQGLYIGGLTGYSTGTITSSTLSGTFTVEGTGTDKTVYAGGFIGGAAGTITNCKVEATTATVKAQATQSAVYTGGFTGDASGDGKISGCTSNMAVEASGATVYAGGFVGNTTIEFDKCSTTGSVSLIAATTAAYVGGFAGVVENCTLDTCSASGAITTKSTTATPSIGGFVGWLCYSGQDKSEIVNSFTLSTVPANTDGGFVGKAGIKSGTTLPERVQINNSFSKNGGSEPSNNDATYLNYHHNGNQNVEALNEGCRDGWLTWTISPAIYGTNIPYFVR